MLEFIPKKYLERGMITSLLDEDRPVIESYSYNDRVHTVAYLHGFPVPYNIFIYAFTRKTLINSKGEHNLSASLGKFWNEINLPRIANDRYHQDKLDIESRLWVKKRVNADDILRVSMDRIFEAADAPKIVAKSSSILDNTKIKELIARIESDYEYSLQNPIVIYSVSTSTTIEESSISSDTNASI